MGKHVWNKVNSKKEDEKTLGPTDHSPLRQQGRHGDGAGEVRCVAVVIKLTLMCQDKHSWKESACQNKPRHFP